jgi:hypothetical protein
MEITMQERKKLTMLVAQANGKATKSKKTQMLDDFCQSTGYCRRYAARVLPKSFIRAIDKRSSSGAGEEIAAAYLAYRQTLREALMGKE